MTDDILDRLFTAFDAEVRGIHATGAQLLIDAHHEITRLRRRNALAEAAVHTTALRNDQLAADYANLQAEHTAALAAAELARDNDAARYRAALTAALNRFDRAEAYRLAIEQLPARIHRARTPAAGPARDSRLLAEVVKTITTANRRYATQHTQHHPEGISA